MGIRQLQETFGIAGKKALVVGSGHTATLALRYLYEYGVSHVTVCSRTFSHAGNLLHEFPTLTIIPFEKRYEAMKECELVVSATASPHHIIREKTYSCYIRLQFWTWHLRGMWRRRLDEIPRHF